MAKPEPSQLPPSTEPLPRTAKPALLFLLFLAGVVGAIALASYLIDRAIYG